MCLATCLRFRRIWRAEQVSDGAHALSPTDFATLNALVNSVYEMYGMEICVVTVDDVESCRDGHGLHGFATKLFNKWSIGDKKTGNGMLLLWVKDQRTVEIVTGEGQHMGAHRGQLNKKGLCRVLPDRWCRNELSRWYIPYFKAGQFGTGLMRAVQRVVEQVCSLRRAVSPPFLRSRFSAVSP
eukprot:SAG11_NODE_868_length_6814_cov_13.161430_2_plen_183_part_00